MRPIGLILALLLVAASAIAEETEKPKSPDFSRDTLIKLFSETTVTAKRDPAVELGFGYIDFRALGMRWRVGYLPFLAPMQGSQPWRNVDRWPDPFILTGTEIATTPRTFARTREINSELKKLEKRLKKDAKVTVKPE